MDIQTRDLRHFWHPCSQMKDYESFPPLPIKRAEGSYLELESGQRLIDAFSSWWCKSLGHGHPKIRDALFAQAEKFEHVIAANTCNETVVSLSEKLGSMLPSLSKVMYASDGSSAIEIALKMALHAQALKGNTERNQFMALENDFHGETCLAMATSDVGLYKDPYKSILPPVHFLKGIPYLNNASDPLWDDCASAWPALQKQLDQHAKTLAAIIVEPVLQGACGMQLYSPNLLSRLRAWCKENDVYLISDEILTGIGRTGAELAMNLSGVAPDIFCLSKGLTSGWLPLSAVVVRDEIYDLFYDDYETNKAFMHSHTYTGNPLAAACANACLSIMEEEKIYQYVSDHSHYLLKHMEDMAVRTGKLNNVRGVGFMVAADLITEKKRGGYAVYQKAIELGALLRPLGNTLYWMPPLNTRMSTIDELRDITLAAIEQTAL